ncbi:uncharacterized protein LOC105767229 [Gossypium raimondii]|uniref:uncharacterized protein LOC105767229 n=1 Tax=Gossypium raimondii TaxID=29730 RepID=UPI00063A8ED6|nr:uncharacterized protein LOC105767229 [Gossypium raimondii]
MRSSETCRRNTMVFEHQGNLSSKLQKLNREVYGHIGRRKQDLTRRIGKIQAAFDRKCSRFLLELELKLKIEYENIIDEEESLWRQKSKIEWIQQGDWNTNYFDTKTLRRRNFNKISTLKVNGDWCFKDEALQREAIRFHKSLHYLDDQSQVFLSLAWDFSRIDMEGLETMTREVTINEIHSDLFNMGPLKAPGSDGFHTLFYQN